MKLLLLKLFGLAMISIISSKSSIKKASAGNKKSSIKAKKASAKAKAKAKLPDGVTFGYASNDNILQNAAVTTIIFSIFFCAF